MLISKTNKNQNEGKKKSYKTNNAHMLLIRGYLQKSLIFNINIKRNKV